MTALALALSSFVVAQAGAPAEAADVYVPSGDVYCEQAPAIFDPSTVYATQDAAPDPSTWTAYS
jgi:hypothetical protein